LLPQAGCKYQAIRAASECVVRMLAGWVVTACHYHEIVRMRIYRIRCGDHLLAGGL